MSYKHVMDECDHRNQQNPPFLKLHIELLKQFEGSKTFTNLIGPLLPKKTTEQPRLCIYNCARPHSALQRPDPVIFIVKGHIYTAYRR
jgi:hypothetical protein